MPRWAARTDSPHAHIRDSLRKLGFAVADTARCPGFVDLVVGLAGRNYLMEVKPEGWTKPRSKKERDQQEWRAEWNRHGQVQTVRTLSEALAVLGIEISDGKRKPDQIPPSRTHPTRSS